jgi:hypothetical protein
LGALPSSNRRDESRIMSRRIALQHIMLMTIVLLLGYMA